MKHTFAVKVLSHPVMEEVIRRSLRIPRRRAGLWLQTTVRGRRRQRGRFVRLLSGCGMGGGRNQSRQARRCHREPDEPVPQPLTGSTQVTPLPADPLPSPGIAQRPEQPDRLNIGQERKNLCRRDRTGVTDRWRGSCHPVGHITERPRSGPL